MAEEENKSEDELLKEWDSMLSGDGENKAKNQDEIDNLASDGETDDTTSENKGIKAVLEKALQSYEKLPMLEIVFERLVRLLTTAMRNLTSESVDIETVSMDSLRFNTYINKVPAPTLISIFKAVEWENFGLMIMDNSLVFSLVDVLFGGKKTQTPVKTDGRGHTEIEQGLVKQISEVILNELGAAFDPISPSTFAHERIETNPYFVNICRPGDAIILLKLKMQMEDRGGNIDIMIPYGTLEPIKNLLTQVFMGDKFGTDIEWEESLYEAIQDVEFPLEAVIINKPVTIFDITQLKIGHTIVTEHEANEDVLIRSETQPLCRAQIGKVNDNLACHVTKFFSKEDDE